MKKRRTFTAKQKAAIVIEALQSSDSLVRQKYHLAPSLVEKWKTAFLENADKAFGTQAEKETTKKIHQYERVITKLTTQNDFLEKVLRTLD